MQYINTSAITSASTSSSTSASTSVSIRVNVDDTSNANDPEKIVSDSDEDVNSVGKQES